MARNSQPQSEAPAWTCNLDPAHCRSLNEALRKCNDLRCFLQTLQAAGAPVDQWQDQVGALEQMATSLKAAVFPQEA